MTRARSDTNTAVLVAVQLPGVSDVEHAGDLAELARLVQTLGYEVLGSLSQKRAALSRAAVLGEGKLVELGALTGGTGVLRSGAPAKKDKARLKRAQAAEPPAIEVEPSEAAVLDPAARPAGLVVVDHELTPSQLRNLEIATGAEVLDRTGVIVEIFHRHAKSRQAKLEVELARLAYMAPRLREAGGGGERLGGRAAGESALELDRRNIRDRMAELRQELAAVARESDVRREQRREARRVALVGYTNAGKSSLMRALTGSEVLVADKLFATLDTTVRVLQPEAVPRILVSDTVGFIKKLPHALVASFRSTLDEAREASLLLFVADASDPTFRAQLEVTRGVLSDIGVAGASRLVLNKVDRLAESERAALRAEFPEAILLSALSAEDVAKLRDAIVEYFESAMVEEELVIPYAQQQLIARVHESARVLREAYDEEGTRLRVLADPAELARLKSAILAFKPDSFR